MKTEIHSDVARRRERADSQRRRPDVICLSHLRWDFVLQRPQHLLSRCARRRRVFFVEEPVLSADIPRLDVRERISGVHVATPLLPEGLHESESVSVQGRLIAEMCRQHRIEDYVLWYYTPMALPFTRHLTPRAVVYDCMDELSAFAGAHTELREREAELLERATLVLTGGHSLYEAKRLLHPNVHPMPSSVDVAHFAKAREKLAEPADQAHIPHPRLGFFGVIDERMDIELLRAVASARPDLHFVMLGPVVKIDPDSLPRLPNIHYLGKKAYDELPAYLAGWDVALLPFARNQATRFISPTKTPEYLAACRHVVSTSIRDVVRPYGELGLVRIADTPGETIAAVDACLAEEQSPLAEELRAARRARIDAFLAKTSWDGTWARVEDLLDQALRDSAGKAS
jgi:hypothetical protein